MQCRVVVKLTSKGRQLRDLTGDVMNCVTAAVGTEDQCLSLMQQLQDLREHLKRRSLRHHAIQHAGRAARQARIGAGGASDGFIRNMSAQGLNEL